MIIKFKIVRIDPNYCNYLRKFDDRVMYNNNEKICRPFVGILFKIDKVEYFAPLSSPKPKHQKMKNSIDFLKIDSGKLGVVNFNNMIPVISSNYELVDLNCEFESEETLKYKKMLLDQLRWLNSNFNQIRNKSLKLYEMYNNNKLPDNIKKRCCNFKKLEKECLNYNNTNK